MGIIEEALVAYTYVGMWIGLSAGVILFNKYVLTVFGFPFPVALTMIHMAFCSALAFLLVRVFKVVKGVNMTRDQYVQRILPIGFLFSIVLWFGNSAYVYLSVAFIQMVKALMPCVVYGVGIAFKVETYKPQTLANMAMIAPGVPSSAHCVSGLEATTTLRLTSLARAPSPSRSRGSSVHAAALERGSDFGERRKGIHDVAFEAAPHPVPPPRPTQAHVERARDGDGYARRGDGLKAGARS